MFTADLFVDPNDPRSLLAIGRNANATESRLYRSRDQGLHFDELLYDEPTGVLVGVEVARDAGNIMYVTGTHRLDDAGTAVTFIARSDDDGQSFAVADHAGSASTCSASFRSTPPTRISSTFAWAIRAKTTCSSPQTRVQF